MRIKFVRVDEIDRKKLALNLAKKAQNRKESGARAGDLLARMGTHKFNPEGASTGPLKEPIQGGRKSKAQRLAKRASFFRKKGLSTPGQADPGTAQDRERALAAGEERGRNRRGMNRAMRQNASTEILGNKMVEGFNKLFQEATISKSRGKGKGEIVKDVKLSKGAIEAMKKRGTKVPGGYSVPSKGKRLPTEIAEAVIEGFDKLLSELSTKTLKSYQGKAIGQMRQGKKSGLSGAKMAKRGKMIHKAGEKIKAQSGDQKPGQFKRSEEEKLTGKTKKVAEARGDTLAARFEKKSGKPFPEDLNVPERGKKAGPRIKAAVRIARGKGK